MSHRLDIDQLKTFVSIAETGSFTAAAGEVHKTQSAVSMQMKRLEERVGRAIFERDGRQSRLTQDGIRLLEYARRIVRLSDEAVMALSEPELAGAICIGLPDDFADRLLPKVLASFAHSHPRIEINVTCAESMQVYKKIRAGELDLAIVTHGDCGGYGDIIRREGLHWVTSDLHDTHTLDPLPLSMGPHSCTWRKAAIQALDKIGRAYRIAYVSGSAVATTGAVNAGLAVSVLSGSTVRPEMRVLTAEDGFPELPPVDIALLRADHATSPVHDALACHIKSKIGNLTADSVTSRQIAAE